MAVRCNKREGPISHVVFKSGVALAFSLGGILFTFLRSKRTTLPKPKPSLPSPGKGSHADSDIALENSSLSRVHSSSNGRAIGDIDASLLSEFNHLLKEYTLATDDVSIKPNNEQTKECERELRSLRSKVKILEEREKILENQLLEYYGLKEQENAVLELQTQLRVHIMEAKLYSLKIESLHSDNKRLQAKVADYDKVVAELESSQAKIELLRKKLRFEGEQNKEQILKLQDRVLNLKLQENEKKTVEIDIERDRLEEELEVMKKHYENLKVENLELGKKVKSLQMIDRSSLDDREVEKLKEEGEVLRQENEKLREEIEQLQGDRCTDVEELFYLRWINSCLRYELRNYQPSPNEEKAKNRFLTYANSEEWSISPSIQDSKTNHSNKKKVLAKLMNVLRGKDNGALVNQETRAMP